MTTHVLYRMFDAGERLLYVGLTCNPSVRIRQHRESAAWWCDVFNIRLEHFNSRDELERAEQSAIQSESPVYNVVRYSPARARRSPPMAPLSSLRHVAGLSLDALAKRMAEETDCAPGRGTLCAIESGDRGASLDILHALETVYGLPDGTISTTWEPRAPRGRSKDGRKGTAA